LSGEHNLYSYVNDSNVEIDVFGLSSAALDGALGGTPRDNMQAHHLVPEKTWADNESFLNEVGLSGERDKASNGLLMHDSANGANANDKAYYHRGRHDRYSAVVDNRIKNIEADYRIHGDKQKAKAEIRDLQSRLRRALDRNSTSNKAKRVGYKKK